MEKDDLKGLDFLPMFYHVRQKVDYENQMTQEMPEQRLSTLKVQ